MPGSPTTIYGLIVPTVGGDTNSWGGELNTNLATLDGIIGLPRIKRATLSGATPAIDIGSTGSNFYAITITVPATISITNTPSGTFASEIILKMINGGAAAVTWPASVNWLGTPTTAPVLKASGTDFIRLWTNDNGTTWYGDLLGRQALAAVLDVRVTKSADQSLSNNVFADVSWNTETYDDGTLHDNATNNERLTVPTSGDGLYVITANLGFNVDTTGADFQVNVRIYKNAGTSTLLGEVRSVHVDQTGIIAIPLTIQAKLVATDFVRVQAMLGTSGVFLTSTIEADDSSFAMVRVTQVMA